MGSISKSLVVKFLGDATQLKGVYSAVTKDAQKFDKEVKKHGVSMQAVGKIMLAVGGTIVGAMASTVLSVAKSAREIEHAATVAGTTAEEYQRLAAAGKKVLVSGDEITNGLGKLAKSMNTATSGTGTQAEAFAKLGVNVQTADGHLRKNSDVLLDVADKFKGMTNGTEKAALAQELFGKAGSKLLPILNLGSEGINKFADGAQRMGGIISDESVQQLADLDRKIQTLSGSMALFGKQIAVDLVPNVNAFADTLVNLNKWIHSIPENIRQAITVGTALTGVLALIAGVIVTVVIPALTAMGLATALATAGIGTLVGGLTYLASTNQKAAAIMWDVWDRVGAFLNGAWKGLETSCWALIREMLKALNTFTGWIPGWGSKLNAAILAVEEQRQASLAAATSEWNTVVKGTYEAHYNWLVERNKKKNDNVTKQDKDAEQQKQLQLKEAQDKAKQAAQERLNNEKEAYEKLFAETHNELERLNHEEELALSKSNMSEKAKADVRAYYVQKRLDLAKEEAKKREDIEEQANQKLKNEVISALNDIANDENKSDNERIAALRQSLALQLGLKQTEYKKELKAAEDVGADTANIEKLNDQEVLKLKQETASKEAVITKASTDKQESIIEKANDEYLDEMRDTYQRDASNYSSSSSERITALEGLKKLELNKLNKWYAKEKKAAQGNATALEKIDKAYEAKKLKIVDDTESEIQDIAQTTADKYAEQAEEIVGYLDQITTGEKSAKEIAQDLVVNWMSTEEEKSIAKGLAGIAQAWAEYGYAAIPLIATITATTAASVAGWEVAKAAVRGLAEGGVTTGPSVNLIGEGAYQEAVLPLSDEVFAKIGQGIVSNSTNNNSTTNNSDSNSTSTTKILQVGGYIDKSGLKKLWRDLEPIKTSEDKRKGKK